MFEGLWSVGAFIVAIGVLVSFHEFGHFWVARKLGVQVLRFSVGFGRPLWMRRGADGVEYVIAAIPLGGYVKMLDEREAPVAPADRKRAFNTQPVSARIAIVAAGPIFNFLLAIACYWAVFVGGVPGLKPLLASPPPGTAAAAAGVRSGELVTAINGRPVQAWQELHTELLAAALEAPALTLELREGEAASRTVMMPLTGVRVDPEFLFQDLGLMPFDPPIPPLLEEVVPGDPADLAGLRAGDRLLARDGVAIVSWQDWAAWLRAHPGDVVRVQVQRGDEQLEREMIVARSDNGQGRFGARVAVPESLWRDLRVEVSYGPLQALPEAATQVWRMSWLTLKMLGRMITGDVSVKNVSGPIQIAQFAGYSASAGWITFLTFMAVISISLGVLNLLPVPVLDGGHLLFYAIEAVKGSPLSERVQALGQRFGVTVLLALMGLAFYNDLQRLLS